MEDLSDEEILAIDEALFYYYNIEGNSELTCSDEVYCSDYLYCV